MGIKNFVHTLPFDSQQYVAKFLGAGDIKKTYQSTKESFFDTLSPHEISKPFPDAKIAHSRLFLGFAPKSIIQLDHQIKEIKGLDDPQNRFKKWFLEQPFVRQKILLGKWSLAEAIQHSEDLTFHQQLALQQYGLPWEIIATRKYIDQSHLLLLAQAFTNPSYTVLYNRILKLTSAQAKLLNFLGIKRILNPLFLEAIILSDDHIHLLYHHLKTMVEMPQNVDQQHEAILDELFELGYFLNYLQRLQQFTQAQIKGLSLDPPLSLEQVFPQNWEFTPPHVHAIEQGIPYDEISELSAAQVNVMLLFEPPLTKAFLLPFPEIDKQHFLLLVQKISELEKMESKSRQQNILKDEEIAKILSLSSLHARALNAGFAPSHLTSKLSSSHIKIVELKKATAEQALTLTVTQTQGILAGLTLQQVKNDEDLDDPNWFTEAHLLAYEKEIPFHIIDHLPEEKAKSLLELEQYQIQGLNLGFSLAQVCNGKFNLPHIKVVRKNLFRLTDITDLTSAQIKGLLDGLTFEQVTQIDDNSFAFALLRAGLPFCHLAGLTSDQIQQTYELVQKAQKYFGKETIALALQLGFKAEHLMASWFSHKHIEAVWFSNIPLDKVIGLSSEMLEKRLQSKPHSSSASLAPSRFFSRSAPELHHRSQPPTLLRSISSVTIAEKKGEPIASHTMTHSK